MEPFEVVFLVCAGVVGTVIAGLLFAIGLIKLCHDKEFDDNEL